MTFPFPLSTLPSEYPAMDYAFLRSEGIRLLEQLGGQLWTDFNTHDPGITILEQVCYAITDLGYRINYDIQDLLASSAGDPYASIYSPAEVLTTNPVTLTDLRKLILDVPGVKNAWIEPIEKLDSALLYDPSDESIYFELLDSRSSQREPIAIQGIYRVRIEKDNDSNFDAAGILTEVTRRLHACRALGDDFLYPEILPGQGITVNARIEVSAIENPERVLAQVCLALADFISPHINFYALDEMLKKNKRIDEIMNGPALQHGFIEDVELEGLERKASLRTSDLIQEIMNIDGVVAVERISMSSGSTSEDWFMKLDPERAPYFDIESSLFSNSGPTIRLTRGGIEAQPNLERAWEMIKTLQTNSHKTGPLPGVQRDIQLPIGSDRKVSHYFPIQNQFPTTYGIGTFGLPESASPQRKAQAKQLKAYLLFFDQILANYFAQLGNAMKLFSFDSQQSPSYFSQIVDDEGLELAEIRFNNSELHAKKVQDMTETPDLSWERKNRFLNHLLARFAEQFTDYSLLQFASFREEDLVNDKSAFLRAYREIGRARGSGFDYTRPVLEGSGSSGLRQRINRKLGILENHPALADLSGNSDGGFYLMEHTLLRPHEADVEQYKGSVAATNWQAGAFLAQAMRQDPYSHQISFIFPNWIKRFKEPGFSNLIEKTIREETPAHIRAYIHWFDKDKMREFEAARSDWLEGVRKGRLWNLPSTNLANETDRLAHLKIREARDRMVEALGIGLPYPLSDLRLIYPDMVAFDQPTTILIEGGQIGVLYQLCDEDGNPILENGNRFEVRLEAVEAGKEVRLPTPNIQRDISFTVLAIREGGDPPIRLEVYLNQMISIQSGIDTFLDVAFLAGEGQSAHENALTIPYAEQVTVQIFNSQEGISYKLVTGPDDNPVNLSGPQKGNRDVINLVTSDLVLEDTPLRILAYRTNNWHLSSLLKAELLVNVRPNPAVSINLQPEIVNYEAEATLSLTGYQTTAGYQLYKRELVAAEYLSVQAVNGIQIHTDEGKDIFIAPPEQITDWEAAAGFALVSEFSEANGSLSIKTGNLAEDTLFIVRATKTENGETLQLNQAVAVLVRPNPAPEVSIQQDTVAAGTEGVVTVSGTQKGVSYQLRFDSNNTPVNPPGYDLADRGVDTMRLEVDFVVEEQGDAILLLPTKPITKATTFNILAEKILTGVQAELTGKAEIKVSA